MELKKNVRTSIKFIKIEASAFGRVYVGNERTEDNIVSLPQEITTEIDFGKGFPLDVEASQWDSRSIVVRTTINYKKGLTGHPFETATTIVELGKKLSGETLAKKIPPKVHEKSIWEAIEEHNKICEEIEKDNPFYKK